MTRNIGKQIGVEEKQVTIRMLSVDGRNMTKAFFRQLSSGKFDENEWLGDEVPEDVWGVVLDDGAWLIRGGDGEIWREDVSRLSKSLDRSVHKVRYGGVWMDRDEYNDMVDRLNLARGSCIDRVLKEVGQLFIGA